jgi:protein-S-isoprenylcysteine O-methyltransferase Ste14
LSFKKQDTTVNPLQPEKASSLVITGLFKYSRNPMYLGMLLLLLSLTAKFNVIGGLLITLGFLLFMTKFQIIPEERALESKFGEKFAQYKGQTRRWL